MNELNLHSLRARKARLARRLNVFWQNVLLVIGVGLTIGGVYLLQMSKPQKIGYLLIGTAVLIGMLVTWIISDLNKISIKQHAENLDDILESRFLGSLKKPVTPASVWGAAMDCTEARFIYNHLLFDTHAFAQTLSKNEADMPAIWQQAGTLVSQKYPTLHAGVVVAAMLTLSPAAREMLTASKLRDDDVLEVLSWLNRQTDYAHAIKLKFGGIGRDWATGYTPTLERFGQNISLAIEHGGGLLHETAHANVLDDIVNNLSRQVAVALVAPDGIGKTQLVYSLANELLTGKWSELKYYQIVSLNASEILSYSGAQLENLLLQLFNEAVASGNMIIFLDDAELFFGTGAGAFDLSQILLPILKNHSLKIIAAFSPTTWQQLQATRQGLISSFASFSLTEPDQKTTMKILEDTAVISEIQNNALITFESLQEAYRLSGQFMQEQAYPGKAITLLEQSMSYATNHVLTAKSIQASIENTRGVKVSSADAPESTMLLNLENLIHERMINQTRAVGVVSNALRRGRAGVSNPKRPIGSFLFLGPTGVGKTELAKSLAAVYFGDEHHMIRLDMSEYQQPEDVTRLLSAGGQNEKSLLMAIREQPFSVVLLDEIEKAHPNILNLLLQMLDEGQLTDEQGRRASFRSSIIITTSNAGAAEISERVRQNQPLDDYERPLIDKLISDGLFKPELINRFDEIVLFRPLNKDELAQVAKIMLAEVNKTLEPQQITVQLTDAALQEIVRQGYDPEFGARPMRRIIQKTVENTIAVKILANQAEPGSSITLDVADVSN